MESSGEKSPLPWNSPKELQSILQPYIVLLSPALDGMGQVCEWIDPVHPMTQRERESGEIGIAAYMYESGIEMNAGVFLLIWASTVIGFRVANRVIANRKKHPAIVERDEIVKNLRHITEPGT